MNPAKNPVVLMCILIPLLLISGPAALGEVVDTKTGTSGTAGNDVINSDQPECHKGDQYHGLEPDQPDGRHNEHQHSQAPT